MLGSGFLPVEIHHSLLGCVGLTPDGAIVFFDPDPPITVLYCIRHQILIVVREVCLYR